MDAQISEKWWKSPSKENFITVLLVNAIFWAFLWIVMMVSLGSKGKPFRADFASCFGTSIKAIFKQQSGCSGRVNCGSGEGCFRASGQKCGFFESGCICLDDDDCYNVPCEEGYECLKNPIPCEIRVNQCKYEENECTKESRVCSCVRDEDVPGNLTFFDRLSDDATQDEKECAEVVGLSSLCSKQTCVNKPLSYKVGEKCTLDACEKAHAFNECCEDSSESETDTNTLICDKVYQNSSGDPPSYCLPYVTKQGVNDDPDAGDWVFRYSVSVNVDDGNLECENCRAKFEKGEKSFVIDDASTPFCLADPETGVCCTDDEVRLFNKCCVPPPTPTPSGSPP